MEDRLLQSRDMAKLGCQDCAGCFDCCKGMGNSILLDPYDVMQLRSHLHKSFEQLLQREAELHVEGGIILPSLKMTGTIEQCVFLDQSGRCSIHAFRPGLCRLFPLGRDYSTGGLRYFLLENGCTKKNRSKVKIEKWLSVPELKRYEEFLTVWHGLLKQLRAMDKTEEKEKAICTALLQIFYLQEFPQDDFYPFFFRQLDRFQALL